MNKKLLEILHQQALKSYDGVPSDLGEFEKSLNPKVMQKLHKMAIDAKIDVPANYVDFSQSLSGLPTQEPQTQQLQQQPQAQSQGLLDPIKDLAQKAFGQSPDNYAETTEKTLNFGQEQSTQRQIAKPNLSSKINAKVHKDAYTKAFQDEGILQPDETIDDYSDSEGEKYAFDEQGAYKRKIEDKNDYLSTLVGENKSFDHRYLRDGQYAPDLSKKNENRERATGYEDLIDFVQSNYMPNKDFTQVRDYALQDEAVFNQLEDAYLQATNQNREDYRKQVQQARGAKQIDNDIFTANKLGLAENPDVLAQVQQKAEALNQQDPFQATRVFDSPEEKQAKIAEKKASELEEYKKMLLAQAGEKSLPTLTAEDAQLGGLPAMGKILGKGMDIASKGLKLGAAMATLNPFAAGIKYDEDEGLYYNDEAVLPAIIDRAQKNGKELTEAQMQAVKTLATGAGQRSPTGDFDNRQELMNQTIKSIETGTESEEFQSILAASNPDYATDIYDKQDQSEAKLKGYDPTKAEDRQLNWAMRNRDSEIDKALKESSKDKELDNFFKSDSDIAKAVQKREGQLGEEAKPKLAQFKTPQAKLNAYYNILLTRLEKLDKDLGLKSKREESKKIIPTTSGNVQSDAKRKSDYLLQVSDLIKGKGIVNALLPTENAALKDKEIEYFALFNELRNLAPALKGLRPDQVDNGSGVSDLVNTFEEGFNRLLSPGTLQGRSSSAANQSLMKSLQNSGVLYDVADAKLKEIDTRSKDQQGLVTDYRSIGIPFIETGMRGVNPRTMGNTAGVLAGIGVNISEQLFVFRGLGGEKLVTELGLGEGVLQRAVSNYTQNQTKLAKVLPYLESMARSGVEYEIMGKVGDKSAAFREEMNFGTGVAGAIVGNALHRAFRGWFTKLAKAEGTELGNSIMRNGAGRVISTRVAGGFIEVGEEIPQEFYQTYLRNKKDVDATIKEMTSEGGVFQDWNSTLGFIFSIALFGKLDGFNKQQIIDLANSANTTAGKAGDEKADKVQINKIVDAIEKAYEKPENQTIGSVQATETGISFTRGEAGFEVNADGGVTQTIGEPVSDEDKQAADDIGKQLAEAQNPERQAIINSLNEKVDLSKAEKKDEITTIPTKEGSIVVSNNGRNIVYLDKEGNEIPPILDDREAAELAQFSSLLVEKPTVKENLTVQETPVDVSDIRVGNTEEPTVSKTETVETPTAEEANMSEVPPSSEEVSISKNSNNSTPPKEKKIEEFSNEDEFYRVVVGDEAFQDIVQSGVVRTNAADKKQEKGAISLGNRPTAFPSFSKGKASVEYAKENPNNYIIVTNDESIKPSTVGRHGKGSTMFPTDINGKHQKELDAKKVSVYKHVGEGKYELVYDKGELVQPKEELVKPVIKQPKSLRNGGQKPATAKVEQPTKVEKVAEKSEGNIESSEGEVEKLFAEAVKNDTNLAELDKTSSDLASERNKLQKEREKLFKKGQNTDEVDAEIAEIKKKISETDALHSERMAEVLKEVGGIGDVVKKEGLKSKEQLNTQENENDTETSIKTIGDKAESTSEADLVEAIAESEALIDSFVENEQSKTAVENETIEKVEELAVENKATLKEQKASFLSQLDDIIDTIWAIGGSEKQREDRAALEKNTSLNILSKLYFSDEEGIVSALKEKGYELNEEKFVSKVRIKIKDDGEFSFPVDAALEARELVSKSFPTSEQLRDKPTTIRKNAPRSNQYSAVAISRGSLDKSEKALVDAQDNLKAAEKALESQKAYIEKNGGNTNSEEKLIEIFKEQIKYEEAVLREAQNIDFEVEKNEALKEIAREADIYPRTLLDKVNEYGVELTLENAQAIKVILDYINEGETSESAIKRYEKEKEAAHAEIQSKYGYKNGKTGIRNAKNISEEREISRLRQTIQKAETAIKEIKGNELLDSILSTKNLVEKTKAEILANDKEYSELIAKENDLEKERVKLVEDRMSLANKGEWEKAKELGKKYDAILDEKQSIKNKVEARKNELLPKFATGEETSAEDIQPIIDFFDPNGTLFAPLSDFAEKGKEIMGASGKVIGFTNNGKIYLNPNALTKETAFHELIHVQQAMIRAAAKKGDIQAKLILKRFNEVLETFVEKVKKDKIIKIGDVRIDLSSDVYSQKENESDSEYKERITDELWAYLQAPVNVKKWEKINGGLIKNFLNAVKNWFNKVFGLKDVQSMTLEQLLDKTAGSLAKKEYFGENAETKGARYDTKNIKLNYNSKGQHLASNRKPSNLTEQQAKIVRTPEFKKWFGDWEKDPKNASKVVDENGEPLVVYHGTNSDFNTFDTRKLGSTTDAGMRGRGFYFSPNKTTASSYTENKEGVKGFFLNITEPIDLLSFKNRNDLANKLGVAEYLQDYPNSINEDTRNHPILGRSRSISVSESFTGNFTAKIKEKGYNGIVHAQEYVAFSPNQIKLADGTNETFNPNSNDIRFATESDPIAQKADEYFDKDFQEIAQSLGLDAEEYSDLSKKEKKLFKEGVIESLQADFPLYDWANFDWAAYDKMGAKEGIEYLEKMSLPDGITEEMATKYINEAVSRLEKPTAIETTITGEYTSLSDGKPVIEYLNQNGINADLDGSRLDFSDEERGTSGSISIGESEGRIVVDNLVMRTGDKQQGTMTNLLTQLNKFAQKQNKRLEIDIAMLKSDGKKFIDALVKRGLGAVESKHFVFNPPSATEMPPTITPPTTKKADSPETKTHLFYENLSKNIGNLDKAAQEYVAKNAAQFTYVVRKRTQTMAEALLYIRDISYQALEEIYNYEGLTEEQFTEKIKKDPAFKYKLEIEGLKKIIKTTMSWAEGSRVDIGLDMLPVHMVATQIAMQRIQELEREIEKEDFTGKKALIESLNPNGKPLYQDAYYAVSRVGMSLGQSVDTFAMWAVNSAGTNIELADMVFEQVVKGYTSDQAVAHAKLQEIKDAFKTYREEVLKGISEQDLDKLLFGEQDALTSDIQKLLDKAAQQAKAAKPPKPTATPKRKGNSNSQTISTWVRDAGKKSASLLTQLLNSGNWQLGQSKSTEKIRKSVEKAVSVLQPLFPKTEIIYDQTRWDNEVGVNARGVIRGNKIYLNPDLVKGNTPFHELGHIIEQAMAKYNPALHEQAMILVKASDYYKDALTKYSKADAAREAFVEMVADKGEQLQGTKQNVFLRIWDKIKTLFNSLMGKKGIDVFSTQPFEGVTLNDIAKGAAQKIMEGSNEEFEGEAFQLPDNWQEIVNGFVPTLGEIIKSNSELSDKNRDKLKDMLFTALTTMYGLPLNRNTGNTEQLLDDIINTYKDSDSLQAKLRDKALKIYSDLTTKGKEPETSINDKDAEKMYLKSLLATAKNRLLDELEKGDKDVYQMAVYTPTPAEKLEALIKSYNQDPLVWQDAFQVFERKVMEMDLTDAEKEAMINTVRASLQANNITIDEVGDKAIENAMSSLISGIEVEKKKPKAGEAELEDKAKAAALLRKAFVTSIKDIMRMTVEGKTKFVAKLMSDLVELGVSADVAKDITEAVTKKLNAYIKKAREKELRDLINKTPENVQFAKFADEVARANKKWQDKKAGNLSTRLFEDFAIMTDDWEEGLTQTFANLYGISNFTEGNRARIRELAQQISNAPEGFPRVRAAQTFLQYVGNTLYPRGKGFMAWARVKYWAFYYAGMLQNYTTHLANSIGNTLTFAQYMSEKLYGLGSEKGRNEIKAAYGAAFKSIPSAVRASLATFYGNAYLGQETKLDTVNSKNMLQRNVLEREGESIKGMATGLMANTAEETTFAGAFWDSLREMLIGTVKLKENQNIIETPAKATGRALMAADTFMRIIQVNTYLAENAYLQEVMAGTAKKEKAIVSAYLAAHPSATTYQRDFTKAEKKEVLTEAYKIAMANINSQTVEGYENAGAEKAPKDSNVGKLYATVKGEPTIKNILMLEREQGYFNNKQGKISRNMEATRAYLLKQGVSDQRYNNAELANKFADSMLLVNDPTGFAGQLYKMIEKGVNGNYGFALRLVLPFARVSLNLTNRALDRSTLGAIRTVGFDIAPYKADAINKGISAIADKLPSKIANKLPRIGTDLTEPNEDGIEDFREITRHRQRAYKLRLLIEKKQKEVDLMKSDPKYNNSFYKNKVKVIEDQLKGLQKVEDAHEADIQMAYSRAINKVLSSVMTLIFTAAALLTGDDDEEEKKRKRKEGTSLFGIPLPYIEMTQGNKSTTAKDAKDIRPLDSFRVWANGKSIDVPFMHLPQYLDYVFISNFMQYRNERDDKTGEKGGISGGLYNAAMITTPAILQLSGLYATNELFSKLGAKDEAAFDRFLGAGEDIAFGGITHPIAGASILLREIIGFGALATTKGKYGMGQIAKTAYTEYKTDPDKELWRINNIKSFFLNSMAVPSELNPYKVSVISKTTGRVISSLPSENRFGDMNPVNALVKTTRREFKGDETAQWLVDTGLIEAVPEKVSLVINGEKADAVTLGDFTKNYASKAYYRIGQLDKKGGANYLEEEKPELFEEFEAKMNGKNSEERKEIREEMNWIGMYIQIGAIYDEEVAEAKKELQE